MAAEAAGAVAASRRRAIAGKFFFINNLEISLSITRAPGNTTFGRAVGAAHVHEEVCCARTRRRRAGVSPLCREDAEGRLARRRDPQGAARADEDEHAPG